MNIDVSGQHLDLTPALRDYVQTKFEKLASHYDKLGKTHVVLSVEKLQQTAEATVSVDGGTNLFANATNDDMYAAIDALVDKLDKQARKHNDKSNNRRD